MALYVAMFLLALSGITGSVSALLLLCAAALR
jgi:hypothetical protein